jgi:hypothetical protein
MRDAAAMWSELTARIGAEGRDGVWSHPDLLPTADDLDDWTTWVDARSGGGDDVDRELRELLDGGSTDAGSEG